MDVVRHQAVRPYVHAKPLARFGEQGDVQEEIVGSEERLLTPVSSLCDVVGQTGDDCARHAGHGIDATDRVRHRLARVA
jgi:hypothetical protein